MTKIWSVSAVALVAFGLGLALAHQVHAKQEEMPPMGQQQPPQFRGWMVQQPAGVSSMVVDATHNGLFVSSGDSVYRLNAQTLKQEAVFRLPQPAREAPRPGTPPGGGGIEK
jgi:hypothetical protein